jgi:ribose transport system permease protein
MLAKKEKVNRVRLDRDFKLSEYFVVFGLIAMCILITIFKPVFISPANLINVLLQIAINGVLAIGLTMVIITGGIDLSVGSVVCLSGVSMGLITEQMGVDRPITAVVCIIAALVIGTLAGAINGTLITKGKLPPFIATLGMMSIARGMALTLSGGKGVSPLPKFIQTLGGTNAIFVPIAIMLFVYLVAWWLLRYTKLGRNTYAVGGNQEAAILSGINVHKTTVKVYGISGLCCGVASILLVGRLNTAQPTAGIGYELDAIAATVIGGTSMTGGEGKIIGTLIGALIIGVLRNGLNLLNVSSYIQQVVIGLVIILAVLSDTIRDKK